MRVLSVVPRYAVTVGSLKGGTVIGKTPEERGKLHLGFNTLTLCRAANKIRLTARSFDCAQDDDWWDTHTRTTARSERTYITSLPVQSVLLNRIVNSQ